MFEKVENSWKLAKECWRVLMLDKEMLMFPALSTLTTIIVFGLIGYPIWASGYFGPSEATHVDINHMFSLSILLQYALITIVPSYIIYLILTFLILD